MTLINRDSKLRDIILNDPSTITVLDRFGIPLGVGDDKVDDACCMHGINVEFFTTILNTFINENYFPQHTLERYSPIEIVDYLNKTYAYYEQNILPNIERHFSFLLSKAPSHNNNLVLMLQFFNEMKNQLVARINEDRYRWFPAICNNTLNCNNSDEVLLQASTLVINDDNIEDKIDDLINMLIVHLKGDYDHNLGYAVIVAILALKKDFKQNNRIRNRILKPVSCAMLTKNE